MYRVIKCSFKHTF